MADRCVTCGAPGTIAYVLVEHSPVEVARGGRERIVRRSLEHYAHPLCAPCLARVQRRRRQTKVVAGVALAGIAVASGYLIGALVGAPTAVVLALLFGGFGAFAVGVALMVAMQKLLVASLPIAENRGRNIVHVTTDRDDLERVLDKYRLASAQIVNELERARGDAAPLPPARIK